MNKKINYRGFSLVEVLVVVTLFAILSVVVTQSIATTLRNGAKAQAITEVKNNLEGAFLTIQRQLYNAKNTTNCGLFDATSISFVDQVGNAASFQCLVDPTYNVTRVASGSANIWLTSEKINIVSCSFTCAPAVNSDTPDSITVDMTASSTEFGGVDGSIVNKKTQILLRNY